MLETPTHMAICKAQQKGQFYEMQTAIIPLLKQALCAQQGSFQAILSGEQDFLGPYCFISCLTARL